MSRKVTSNEDGKGYEDAREQRQRVERQKKKSSVHDAGEKLRARARMNQEGYSPMGEIRGGWRLEPGSNWTPKSYSPTRREAVVMREEWAAYEEKKRLENHLEESKLTVTEKNMRRDRVGSYEALHGARDKLTERKAGTVLGSGDKDLSQKKCLEELEEDGHIPRKMRKEPYQPSRREMILLREEMTRNGSLIGKEQDISQTKSGGRRAIDSSLAEL